MRNQQGATLFGMLVVGILIVFVVIGGLKIVPAYIEFFTAKKAVTAIAQSNPRGTVADIRYAFQLRTAIDNIDVISAKDLEVTKEGNEIVVSFAYSKRIPLFANVNVVIDFAASSNQ